MRKGQVMTEEQKLKISQAHLGMKKPWVSSKSPEHLKAISEALKGNRNCVGRVPTELHRERIRQALLGQKRPFKPRPKAKGRVVWNKGLKGYLAGSKNPRWISDRNKLKKFHKRIGQAYAIWRTACKDRDKRKCKLGSKECSGMLEVHHIERWIDYPELRYVVSNGIALCHFHHPRTRAKEDEMKEIFKKLIAD